MFELGQTVIVATHGAGVVSYERGIVAEKSETMMKLENLGMVFEDSGGEWWHQGMFGFRFRVLPADDAEALAALAAEEAEDRL